MNQYWILAAILLPILGGVLVMVLPFPTQKIMKIYLEILMILTTIIVWCLLLTRVSDGITVIHFMKGLTISFRIDGMGMIFSGLVSLLWPLAMLYAFEYMEHEEHQKVFFMFYSITYGVTLGIAFAQNILSMYFFYELLTLVTVPLIMHPLTKAAIDASRKYLYYSLGGAAFALIGIIFMIVYGDTIDFVLGGMFGAEAWTLHGRVFRFIYFLAFMGFGVKAAIWPLSSWLPQAGVAPTPVTALLHAVAVVKAGVFAMIRLTYYSFGTEYLRGSWEQYAVMGFAMFTIIYGSAKAVRNDHLKKRLAYSTISNLSYIIFAITLMTPMGLVAALMHMICHAYMKIDGFFCAGAVMHKTGRTQVSQIDGFGRKMPIVFACYAISGLGLMGVPGLAGFISKWNIAQAAVESENPFAFIGIGCLLISALLTTIYMMSITLRAFLPGKDFDYNSISDVKDPSWRMCFPLIVFTVCVVLLGLFSAPLVRFFWNVATGIY